MNLRLFGKTVLQILFAIVMVFGLFTAYVVYASSHAQKKAEAICQSLPIGTSSELAKQVVMKAETDPRLKRVIANDFMMVGFRGAFLDRWMCNLTIKDGKVTAQEVRLLD